MAKYTDNCNLILPEQNENYDVEIANTNNQEIDFQLGNKVNKIPGKDLSTNDFTNEYKSKIDNLQKIYKFKGNVDTYSDLNNISANNGDIYNVLDEAKNYASNGIEWVELGFVIDMSEFPYREEIPTKTSQLENDSEFVNEEKLKELSVPPGGIKGQILEKKSNKDNDVGWAYNDGGITGDTLPIGTVVEFASDTSVPENWLLCNGQEVSRTEYDLLFAVIGTTWGAGDGSTTFNVPTKEGLVTVGKKASDADFNKIGKTGGEKEVVLTVENIAEHSHVQNMGSSIAVTGGSTKHNGVWTDGEYAEGNKAGGYQQITENTGGNQPHNNLQPYVTSNFIIKAKQSAGVVANVVDSLESDSTTDALSAKQGKTLKENKANKGTVLYSSETGTNVLILDLYDDISNYDRYRIYYTLGLNGAETSCEAHVGKACALFGARTGHFELAEGSYYGIRLIATNARIDGNVLTKSIGYCFTFKTDNTMKFTDAENEIHITKVIGYKD